MSWLRRLERGLLLGLGLCLVWTVGSLTERVRTAQDFHEVNQHSRLCLLQTQEQLLLVQGVAAHLDAQTTRLENQVTLLQQDIMESKRLHPLK